jgi:uncharacterized protein (DUF488 family)
MHEIYTIGHSNHSIEKFGDLLSLHYIEVVCDVRSDPHSKYNPQFNREVIVNHLKFRAIKYVYLGKELGPRCDDIKCYLNGRVQYSLLAQTENFNKGLSRLRTGIRNNRVALMCSEKDPAFCHRTILISRNLRSENLKILHIMEDGTLENNRDTERRLMKILKIPELTLFDKPEDLVEQAYGHRTQNHPAV